MQEEWFRWNPCDIPVGEYIITNFVQNEDGIRIMLYNEDHYVEIFFDGIPSIVRISVEGIRMRTWGEVQLKYKDKGFFRDYFLYEVKNSKLVEWAIEESCGLYQKEQMRHFCIVSTGEIVDIIP